MTSNKINLGTLNKVAKVIAIACALLLLPIFINNDIFIFGMPLEMICKYILISVVIVVLLFLLATKFKLITIYHKNKAVNVEDIPYISKHKRPEANQGESIGEENGNLNRLEIIPKAVPKFVGIILIGSSVLIIGGVLVLFIFGNAEKAINHPWLLVICLLSVVVAFIGFFILKYFHSRD